MNKPKVINNEPVLVIMALLLPIFQLLVGLKTGNVPEATLTAGTTAIAAIVLRGLVYAPRTVQDLIHGIVNGMNTVESYDGEGNLVSIHSNALDEDIASEATEDDTDYSIEAEVIETPEAPVG